jgi:hypothetical protein
MFSSHYRWKSLGRSSVCTLATAWLLLSISLLSAQQSPNDEQEKRELGPVYPLLKAYDWNVKEHCVFRNFNGVDKNPIPLIAYAVEKADQFQIVTKQAAKNSGLSKEQLSAEAQKNIDAYEAKWESVKEFMLTASGKPFSAEKFFVKNS